MKTKLLTLLFLAMTGLVGKNVAMAQALSIATAEDLNNFAQLVEMGTEVDGVLTADIDLSTSDYPNLMIGTEANPFKGTFDGQWHTITYHYEEVTEKWRGLFAFVEGATIRNLRVEGSVYATNIHFGALIGRGKGNILVENVVTNVDITGMSNTGVQGDAGMIGANYANITFNNCATLGPMGSEISSMYSSYSGWSDGASKTTLNNCYSACAFKEGTGIDGNSGTLTHGSGTNTFNNCYYLNYIDKKQGTQITAEQIANGSLCYKLNGNQEDIVWTQTIGTDPYPMPNPAGKRVYASGTVRCDGAELEDNPLTFSNTESYPNKPDHQFNADGICVVCGQADPDAVKKNAEGYYLIGNAKQLNWLNQKVLEGESDIKALLTDDINLTEFDNPDLMIGSADKQFKGIFDGGGHTITYSYMVTENYGGLFAYMDGATIRNLRIEGEAVLVNVVVLQVMAV